MISVTIKRKVSNESDEAKALRDKMLGSLIKSFNNKNIKVSNSGKPYLENREVGFSVSHSGNGILVAVNHSKRVADSFAYFDGGESYDIGADIEALGIRNIENLNKLCDRKFSAAEVSVVEKSANKELAILEIWTKKEAYLKLIGIGIKGIADADTEALKKDYIFYSKKVSLDGDEFVFSICVKR